MAAVRLAKVAAVETLPRMRVVDELAMIAGKIEGVKIALQIYADEVRPGAVAFDPDGRYLDLLLDGLEGVVRRVHGAVETMTPAPKAVA
jgi:hypothetical protein